MTHLTHTQKIGKIPHNENVTIAALVVSVVLLDSGDRAYSFISAISLVMLIVFIYSIEALIAVNGF